MRSFRERLQDVIKRRATNWLGEENQAEITVWCCKLLFGLVEQLPVCSFVRRLNPSSRLSSAFIRTAILTSEATFLLNVSMGVSTSVSLSHMLTTCPFVITATRFVSISMLGPSSAGLVLPGSPAGQTESQS